MNFQNNSKKYITTILNEDKMKLTFNKVVIYK